MSAKLWRGPATGMCMIFGGTLILEAGSLAAADSWDWLKLTRIESMRPV
jgi:hypothetical protein